MAMDKEQLEHYRHSLAHLLAAAVMELYPDAQRTIGPAIDDGFYFDFAFSQPISEDDLPKIEQKMREILPSWTGFERHEMSAEDAKKEYPGNAFKHELIDQFSGEGQTLTFYKSGNYWDLCRGGHAEGINKADPGSFTLTKLAGAYWRGDEKNAMLTRIYGLAFETKAELEAHLTMLEEAKKRDHRKLGKELELFTFSDMVGPGLPLWEPKGTEIIETLERLAKREERKGGYVRVRTPHITKGDLYVTSGHLPYYKDSMFPPMMTVEGEELYLKPMNCPHHHQIYAARPHSYRELPLRYAEYGTCYRYEQSGELFGLMRVRSMQMNDAHIYCTPEQVQEEFLKVIDLHKYYFELFGIERFQMRLSLHDPAKLGEKYVDNAELWKKTEEQVRQALIASGVPFVEVENEAAFYGPKMDVQVWSSIGREFSLATNQLDFAIPPRFGLTYTDQDGTEKTPLVIHRAPLGTHERFIGFLIEHYAGAFPLWLAPVQVRLAPVGEAHQAFCEALKQELFDLGVRVDLDNSGDRVGAKIRRAAEQKVPWTMVIGDKEVSGEAFQIRVFGQEAPLVLDRAGIITELQKHNV